MFELDELVERLRERTLSVDCVEMTLGQSSPHGSITYIGPGYLRQEADGSIIYKLYPPASTTFDPRSIAVSMGPAGQVLGSDQFYRLKARDVTGIIWQVERTLPSSENCVLDGRHFRVISGEAHELSFTRPFVERGISYLKMVFFMDEKVPRNASTEVTTKSPDGSSSRSSKLDTALFRSVFGDFSIYNKPGMLVVKVVSQRQFPAFFETRIVEALGLVLAKPLAWNFIERCENASETVRVRGRT